MVLERTGGEQHEEFLAKLRSEAEQKLTIVEEKLCELLEIISPA